MESMLLRDDLDLEDEEEFEGTNVFSHMATRKGQGPRSMMDTTLG